MTVQDLGPPQDPQPEKPTAWAPLRQPVFRMLWLVWVATNIAMWMNDVAAAWVMTTLTSSATLIAMVQTASSLPVFLLGLPSGALADIIDRRRYLMFTQLWLAANAAVLYLVSVAGGLTSKVLLLLVFTNGIGFAMRWPVFSALVPELVSRTHLPAALALNGVAVNLSRVVGPLVAGAIIASFGSAYVFALNFFMSLGSGFVLLRWKREAKPPSVLPGERFLGAMRLGSQYVRESRRMKDALVVTASFFVHAAALIALMPLVARRVGSGGANTYTLLLAREHPDLRINACTPGFIETDMTRHYAASQGKPPAELGMKPPAAGATAPMHLLFGALEGNGRYYGSDAKRSPLDRYRSPGSAPYDGT